MRCLLVASLLLISSTVHATVWDDIGDTISSSQEMVPARTRTVRDYRTPNQVLFSNLKAQVVEARKNMRYLCIPMFNITPDITMNSVSAQGAFASAAAGAGARVRNALQSYAMDGRLMPEFVVRAHLMAKAEAERAQAYNAVQSQAGAAVMGGAASAFGAGGAASAGVAQETGRREAMYAMQTNPDIHISNEINAHNQRLSSMMPGTQIDCATGMGRVVSGATTYSYNQLFSVREIQVEQDGFKVILTVPQPTTNAPERIIVNLAVQSAAISAMSATFEADSAGTTKLLSIAMDVDISNSSSEMAGETISEIQGTKTASSKIGLIRVVQDAYNSEYKNKMSMFDFLRMLFKSPEARTALVKQ